jgi:hypothetical protein
MITAMIDRSGEGNLPCLVTAGPGSRKRHGHLLATSRECHPEFVEPEPSGPSDWRKLAAGVYVDQYGNTITKHSDGSWWAYGPKGSGEGLTGRHIFASGLSTLTKAKRFVLLREPDVEMARRLALSENAIRVACKREDPQLFGDDYQVADRIMTEMPKRCGRIDDHDSHVWPDIFKGGIFTCLATSGTTPKETT